MRLRGTPACKHTLFLCGKRQILELFGNTSATATLSAQAPTTALFALQTRQLCCSSWPRLQAALHPDTNIGLQWTMSFNLMHRAFLCWLTIEGTLAWLLVCVVASMGDAHIFKSRWIVPKHVLETNSRAPRNLCPCTNEIETLQSLRKTVHHLSSIGTKRSNATHLFKDYRHTGSSPSQDMMLFVPRKQSGKAQSSVA